MKVKMLVRAYDDPDVKKYMGLMQRLESQWDTTPAAEYKERWDTLARFLRKAILDFEIKHNGQEPQGA
jgi:hypothetical protein